MKIAFRVDASSQIGTGHFMRCLTMANALKQGGGETRFVSRHLPEHLRDMLESNGHQFKRLEVRSSVSISTDLAHSHWLGTSQQVDAQDSTQALSDQIWDWLVVDHYSLDARWESAVRQASKRILAIDDIADRQHDCDLLLDQNFYGDMSARYTGKLPAHCQLVLGPRYALLRDEFRRLHARVKPRAGPVKRVLVFFGGVDSGNYTAFVVEALGLLNIKNLKVDVIVGAQHPGLEVIESACLKYKFKLHVQTNQMAELMAMADLAIGAGGVATWERCCLGLPSFAIATADNQIRQVTEAASAGLLYAPELEGDLTLEIMSQLLIFLTDSKLRRAISSESIRTVDGQGVSRIIAIMYSSNMEIRPATMGDAQNLFEWRNHPTIRMASRNIELIDLESHHRWLTSVLGDPKRILLIGYLNDDPVGVVRFDIREDTAEVSIYLVPEVGMTGQGRRLLKCAELWLTVNQPKVGKILACVVDGNERSRHFFLKSGYQIEPNFFSKRLH